MATNVLYSVKPVYFLSRLIFIWPFKCVNGEMILLSFYEKLTGGLVIILHLLVLTWSLYKRHNKARINIHLSEALLDELSTISATMITLTATFLTIFKYSGMNGIKFFKSLHKIDVMIQFPEESHTKIFGKLKNTFLIQLSFIVIAAAIDNYIWIASKGLAISVWYFNSYGMCVFNSVVIAQINAKMILLKERFLLLNEKLESLVDGTAVVINNKDNKHILIKSSEEAIRNFNKVFDIMCDLVESINNNHGIQIIILSFTILSVTLDSLVIGFALFRTEIEVENAISTSLQFLWSAYYIMLGMSLTNNASTTIKLSQRSSILSHKLLLEYSSRIEDNETLHYSREELKLLIEQVTYRDPTFSAAGFFTVDYTMLYAILGAVTSYFVVLLQLH